MKPTQALRQEVLDELGVISHVQHVVDVGVHQLLLLVAKVLTDVLRDKHDVAIHVDHEEEAVQGLRGGEDESKKKREAGKREKDEREEEQQSERMRKREIRGHV